MKMTQTMLSLVLLVLAVCSSCSGTCCFFFAQDLVSSRILHRELSFADCSRLFPSTLCSVMLFRSVPLFHFLPLALSCSPETHGNRLVIEDPDRAIPEAATSPRLLVGVIVWCTVDTVIYCDIL
uniref:Secreted protein n=1 Tax=Anopheles dirus TaxID=7168 RepID=A0A182NXG0_9DIPT